MNWFKMKHDYHVAYAHDNGFGSITIEGVQIYKRKEFATALAKAIIVKEPTLNKVVILNWIKL